jgi:hypothetical protein
VRFLDRSKNELARAELTRRGFLRAAAGTTVAVTAATVGGAALAAPAHASSRVIDRARSASSSGASGTS